MALERVNPFEEEDRFAVDHLLRYLWARPLVEKKRTVDIACGLGFGTVMLAENNEAEIIGVDSDGDTINRCLELWDHPSVSFKQGLIEEVPELVSGQVDCLVSFETLEHIPDPKAGLAAIKRLLGEQGLFIGSVPGETDLYEENEFHLHSYNEQRLGTLLQNEFKNSVILKQRFHLASIVDSAGSSIPDVVSFETMDAARIDFGKTTETSDSLVFLASDAPLPDAFGHKIALSRQAWFKDFVRAQTYASELKSLSHKYTDLFSRHNKLFFEHGELQRKFTNVLGWGKYHYEVVAGKQPEQHYMETIEKAQSAREEALRAEVQALQAEIRDLKEQKQEESVPEEETRKVQDEFFSGYKKLNTPSVEDPQ
ncbi:methyltransferase domain-containing protein [Puniceicoccales bacterium CK1056]|uniref:Methyltransferase domain-containing protein n=1 Tax=Oceanipulchritudo coccoides TaxID=2706888 RepID=A0A6B2LZU1_9BACT|nr:class I SAM-dependent methyltransferase [Oceanipulchritudo coccoides]NDV62231.1 methyltransferase domain-containing protein [Oceanipulchritudo coccoides]